jgi:hypothetical protein
MRNRVNSFSPPFAISTDYTAPQIIGEGDTYGFIINPNARLLQWQRMERELPVSAARAREVISHLSENAINALLVPIEQGVIDLQSVIKVKTNQGTESITVTVQDFLQAVDNERSENRNAHEGVISNWDELDETPQRLLEAALRLQQRSSTYASISGSTANTMSKTFDQNFCSPIQTDTESYRLQTFGSYYSPQKQQKNLQALWKSFSNVFIQISRKKLLVMTALFFIIIVLMSGTLILLNILNHESNVNVTTTTEATETSHSMRTTVTNLADVPTTISDPPSFQTMTSTSASVATVSHKTTEIFHSTNGSTFLPLTT